MPSWIWFLIWVGLVVVALGVWGYLLYSLGRPGLKIMKSIEKLQPVLQGLNEASTKKFEAEHPADNIGDQPERLQAERERLLNGRRKRKEARARSLVSRVKNIKLEGRFKDVR